MSQGQQISSALAVARAVGVPENAIKLWKPDIEYLPDNCTKYSCGAGKHDQRCHKKASRDRASQWLRNINEGTMQFASTSRLPPPQPTPQDWSEETLLNESTLDELNEAIASVDSSAGEETGAHEDQPREDDATPVRLRAPASLWSIFHVFLTALALRR